MPDAETDSRCDFKGILDPHHLRDLRKSGLTDETIRECGFYSESSYSKLAVMIGWKSYPKRMGTALVIPFRGPSGEMIGYNRIKPSIPKLNRNGKPQKYLGPKGQPQRPYFPPGVIDKLSDPTASLMITEGEKKAAAATQEGFPCIGLTGVFCFNTKGTGSLCPELLQINWKGRDVRIVYDSDLNSNDKVADAESRLAQQLKQQGAKVKVIRLPDGPDGEKQGVDDFLVSQGKVAFVKLYDAAEEPAQVNAGQVDDEFDPMVIAQDFLNSTCKQGDSLKLRFWREEFWAWNRCYSPLPESDLRCTVHRYIDQSHEKITRSMVTNTIESLKAVTHVPHLVEQPKWLDGAKGSQRWLAFANGVGNLDRFAAGQHELQPLSPEFFSPNVLPYEYNTDAQCPKWFDFLMINLEGDNSRVELLQEWFGYCLLPGVTFQKFLMLYGEGGTGKSSACAVLRALLGEENVSSVPLEQFGERFALFQTLGKLANIAADTGELDKTAEGFLKSFTSGDKMQFEKKLKQPIMATPTAKMIIATNNLPRFSDRSSGIWRRISLIPFDAQIPDSQKIRGMDTPQWWLEAGEMPGVFNWAFQGLLRLEERAGFTRSAKCDEIIEQYRTESNPARAFLLEFYDEGVNGFVATADMYHAYSAWCDENGYKRLGNNHFCKEVKRVFPKSNQERKRFDGKRIYGYSGIYQSEPVRVV